MQIATFFRAHVLKSSEAWCNLAKGRPEKYSAIAEALIGAKMAAADRKLDNVLERLQRQVPQQNRLESALISQQAFLKTFETVRNDVTKQVGRTLPADAERLERLNGSISERLETADRLLGRMERYRHLIDGLPHPGKPSA